MALEYYAVYPIARRPVTQRAEDRAASCNNFALDKEQIKRCPIQIDYMRLAVGHHG